MLTVSDPIAQTVVAARLEVKVEPIFHRDSYDYLHEGIDVLATQAPSLHGAVLATKAAGYSHVIIDGTLVETDRIAALGPTHGVDLWRLPVSGSTGSRCCCRGSGSVPTVTLAAPVNTTPLWAKRSPGHRSGGAVRSSRAGVCLRTWRVSSALSATRRGSRSR